MTRLLVVDTETGGLDPTRHSLLSFAGVVWEEGEIRGAIKAPPPEPVTSTVAVSMFEMGFKLSKMTVPRGTVVFHLKNDGKLPHDFSFGSRGGGSPMLQAGQSATFTVKFATPGKYTFICTVEGHQEAGMIGVLTVT